MADLLEEVYVIREKSENGLSKDRIMEEHSDFYTKYPRLFEMSQDANFDVSILKYMMHCKEKINDENVNDVDTEVMTTLKEKYIDSIVGDHSKKNE
jgi:hypothetical protein